MTLFGDKIDERWIGGLCGELYGLLGFYLYTSARDGENVRDEVEGVVLEIVVGREDYIGENSDDVHLPTERQPRDGDNEVQ